MGSCLSLFLARKGVDVTLFDMAPAPMTGASRWNEGRIHLGYIYSADPSLRTAHYVLPGGLSFGRLVSDLLGESLAGEMTREYDLFLVHSESVVDAAHVHRYLDAVSDLVREQPEYGKYLSDPSNTRVFPLSRAELDSVADTRNITAGFRVPERSVRTSWIADRICATLSAEPGVTPRMDARVTSATPVGPVDGSWCVQCEGGGGEIFDVVVNALWHGRLAIDLTAGLAPEGEWSNRYRVSVFARTSRPIDVPNAIVVTGPFGGIRSCNGRDFFLSWYPTGLLSDSNALLPEQPMPLSKKEKQCHVERVGEGLKSVMPGACEVLANADDIAVEGGFVFARGQGSIGDPDSSLHRRDRFGVQRFGRYFSVDTGKFSTAPLLAEALSREITGT
jgi:hypothetical protein